MEGVGVRGERGDGEGRRDAVGKEGMGVRSRKLWAFGRKEPFGNELHEEVQKGVLGKGGAGGFQGKGVGPQGWCGMGEGTIKEWEMHP